MAVDIIEARPIEFRGRQVKCLVAGLMFAGFALAPYPNLNPEFGYLDLWWARLAVLVVSVPFLFVAAGLLRPVTLPVLEVRSDSIRWTYADEEWTVARAAVTTARVYAGYLLFVSAVGDRLPKLNMVPFDRKAVRTALERHGWT